MRYYEVAILSKPLTLTYASKEECNEGDVVEVAVQSRKYRGVVLKEVPKPSYSCKELAKTKYVMRHRAIAKFIAQYYVCTLGESFGLFVPFLQEKTPSLPLEIEGKSTLSPKQQEALKFIRSHPVSLLFGETGSGKTEIYIEYFKEIVKKGKRAIFLMPEISLTPQMQQRLEKIFGEAVVIWHSKLTKKKKEKVLEKIYSGKARIIAGPRSALFLPVEDLGLIVVDEEHDDSYKSQSRPHINAKDIAILMGQKLGISVVLGSATPSVGSYYKFPDFKLPAFFAKKKEFLYDSGEGLSPLIVEHIQKALQEKKQVLVFLPTRAHFKYLICQECGGAVKCPYCDVGMSVHFDKKALVCHYCNFSEFIPKSCPTCKAKELSAKRVGTSEVAQELELLFPNARIAKFDKDAITTQKKLERTIKDFSQKKIDILVGTQMLSKGHDYPDVALSVILDIDYLLAMADYRAREKAASLFVQVAGRAGRREDATVIVQTKNREFFARYKEYELFLTEELAMRKDKYPPFVKLAQLNFAHKRSDVAKSAMEEALACLRKQDIEIVGFGANAIEKIANRYRYHILLRSSSAKKLLQAIYACKNDLCDVDMDPVHLM